MNADNNTIDMTPTWEGIIMSLLVLYTDGTADARGKAKEQIIRVAKIADTAIGYLQRLRAIKARLDGEFDNAELVKLGSLLPSAEEDIRRIISSNVYGKI